jgi:hypothetical protein
MKSRRRTVEELDEILKNLDLGESLGIAPNEKIDNISIEDFTTRSGDVSDNHGDMWRPGSKLHNDEQAAPRWVTRQHASNMTS